MNPSVSEITRPVGYTWALLLFPQAQDLCPVLFSMFPGLHLTACKVKEN
jgi:hypothetical protein